MKKSHLMGAVCVCLILSFNATAAIVTHGNLTTNDTTNYITDTSTGRLYTRFDAFDLSYADTLTAISTGGIFEGWSIATSVIADEFYRALLGLSFTLCDGSVGNGTVCGTVGSWQDGDLGASTFTTIDYFVYLNASTGAGLAKIGDNGVVQDYEFWSTVNNADSYSKVSTSGAINYLLYNESLTSVPNPAAVWLFGSGLIGLIGIARRKVRV